MRSLLFCPGNDAHKLSRVGDFGSDAVALDLEDAVADDEKITARATVKDAILSVKKKTEIVLVRVNSIETGLMAGDIAAVVSPGLDGIVIPKVQDVSTLHEVDQLIALAEKSAGLEVGSIRLVVLIETALGLVRCDEILFNAPQRAEKVIFGCGDFSNDVGVTLTRDGNEILYARSKIVVASRAAGLGAPLDGPYIHIEDDEGLRINTRISRSLGFSGRVVVYPKQVATVQDEYSKLTPTEIASFEKIVEEFENAESRGLAAIRVDGVFIDYPLYYRAKEQLRLLDILASKKENI
jgi:citrate lyase subunit beta / citryl-CoA lyase